MSAGVKRFKLLDFGDVGSNGGGFVFIGGFLFAVNEIFCVSDLAGK